MVTPPNRNSSLNRYSHDLNQQCHRQKQAAANSQPTKSQLSHHHGVIQHQPTRLLLSAVTQQAVHSCLTNITAVNSPSASPNITAVNSHSTSPNTASVNSHSTSSSKVTCQQSLNQHHSCQQALAQPTTLQVLTYNHSNSINKVAAANSHPAKYGCKQSFNWNQQSHTCQQTVALLQPTKSAISR